MLLDGNGNLYIADSGSNSIRMVTPGGIITTVAGRGSGCAGQTDSVGDGCPATSAQLNGAEGIAVDGSGNLYIADRNNSRIRIVTPDRIITTVAGNGTAGYSGDGGAATGAEVNGPYGVAVDGSGNLYISDQNNQYIRKVDTSGIITTIAGNGTASYNGDNIAATSAAVNYPYDLAVDGAGNLYIADYENNRIRRVAPDGIITTVAGTGIYGYDGDNIPATSAELNSPAGVAVDGAGHLYIADEANDRIRKVGTGVGPQCTTSNPNPNPNPASFAAVGDFNGDCKSDILWRNNTTQQVYEWFMNGTTYSGSGSPGSPTSDWVIQSAGDFDGDGKADILLTCPQTPHR
jgi:sugar lactone lactonase YvrE